MVGVLLIAGCGGDDEGPAPEGGAGQPPAAATTTEPGAEQPQPRGDGRPLPAEAAGDGRGGVRLTEIGSFSEPLYITQPSTGGDELYVVEKGGRVRVVSDGEVLEQPFLDISDEVSDGSEQGLLSIAFSPTYTDDGLLYVDYTDLEGDTRVVEYRRSTADPLRADPASAREILFVDQPAENHNGGLVLFGPDGLLYIGLGDGGGADDQFRSGQDLGTQLGKILRIDPRPAGNRPYSIPADNPFADTPGARPEIYSFGLRNPWRFSFDRETGVLAIGDVGQSELEEINVVAPSGGAGANFGWSAFEGNVRFNEDVSAPGAIAPALVYDRSGGCSVTGGYVVRDRRLRSLYGRYLYADFCLGELRSFVPAPSGARGDRALGPVVAAVSSFGEDRNGRVYVVSLEGTVSRLDPR